MKNRASAVLLEMSVMLLVLAVAAAVCLQLFAWTAGQAEENTARDEALVQLQNAAQVLQYYRGDLEAAVHELGGSWENGQWQLQGEGWTIRAVLTEPEQPFLGSAVLEALRWDETILSVTVCWQEVEDGT